MILEPITNQPDIASDRFLLRSVRKSDTGLLQMYSADERIARGTRSIPHPLPPGAIDAFVARAQTASDEEIWVLDGTASGLDEVLGVVALERMDRRQSEISFWIAPACWNSGLASEAVSAIVAANPQSCQTLFAAVFQDNPVSARVLTNAGFDYLGDAEAFSVARNSTVATWTYVLKLH
jgi:RimJ/RimL family protein N-acetyltransferase